MLTVYFDDSPFPMLANGVQNEPHTPQVDRDGEGSR